MKPSSINLGCAVASNTLQIEETGGEVIVFDTKLQLFHLLNDTAYSILKACNGSNNAKDIALLLSAKFGFQDLETITNDVTQTMNEFRAKGLIMFVVDDLQLKQVASDSATDSSLLAVSVSGTSMFPILLSGDKVLVKKSSAEDLNVGDIVVWLSELGNLIAHRILSINVSSTPPLITTKGDLAVDPDPPVWIDRVLGKIVAVLREGGVQWVTELERTPPLMNPSHLERKPSYRRLKVLDLRDISADSIRNIDYVEEVSLVLLSPENAYAWSDVPARDVKAVFTVPDDYRVYTGQPELWPELLEFIQAPLNLVVSGQIFLTAFEPHQILRAFNELILNGQAYVSSVEAKTALESLTNIVSGEICVIPSEHIRWIGQAILGPEYLGNNHQPLVVVGELTVSQRLGGIPDSISLFNNSSGNKADKIKSYS